MTTHNKVKLVEPASGQMHRLPERLVSFLDLLFKNKHDK